MGFPNMAAWASKKGKKSPPKEPAVAGEKDAEEEDGEQETEGDEEDETSAPAAKKPKPGVNPFAAFIKRKRGG